MNINKPFKIIDKLLIGSGVINAIIFNYNINNIDVIRDNKKTKLLISERLMYTISAFFIGPFKFPLYIDYIYIKLLNQNPENYGIKLFPKKEINDFDIFRHL